MNAGQSHTVDLSNVAWALATLVPTPPSLAKVIHRIMSHARPVNTMSGNSVALMLWACSICEARPYMLPLYLVNPLHPALSHRNVSCNQAMIITRLSLLGEELSAVACSFIAFLQISALSKGVREGKGGGRVIK